jgi:hypothetical protein
MVTSTDRRRRTMAFIGAVNHEVRTWLGNVAGELFTGREVVVGCSGNFTIEQILTRQATPATIWGNDVSLYSSVLGAYLSGQDFPLRIKSERLSFVEPYLSTTEDKAASVLVLSEALQYEPEKNLYQTRIWKHYAGAFAFGIYHAETLKKLRGLREKIRLDRYTSRDIWDLLDEISPQSVVVAFLPTYAGGYEKMFKRMEELLEWDRPEYTLIDAERKEAIIRRLTTFDYLYIDDKRREDLPLRCMVEKGRFKTVYLYSNMETPGQYVRPSIGIMPATYPMLDETHEITEASDLTLQRTKNNVINYYRNLYLAKGIDYVNGDECFLVFIDGLLFGFLVFVINKFATADIYLLADFVVPCERYPRLSKLLLLVSKSREVRLLLEVKYLRPIATILTTAFTDKPVSMKYRGPYKLHSRKEGRLNYIAETGQHNLKEVVPLWLKKYHKK